MEIHGCDDKVEGKTENRGSDICTGNRGGGAVKRETEARKKKAKENVMIFPSATTVRTATGLGQFESRFLKWRPK